ncbi:MAG: YneF family protein [Erysipelotrichaceae bacterium]|nr:YneF family protein [Erysipelotrichaceae bacterium]MDD3924361.1 YneF family protein [Erysipelotrichaceae bacterium]MDD4642937.1 YneF family protein [Erysipelotrichaceae bacterium]
MDFWSSLLFTILGMAIGGGLGFFLTRKYFEKQLKENPPINEKMIRAMFMQMGRKPSEAQIKAVMRQMDINK